MDSVDIAWVAGIFEGEGTINFSGSYPQIAVAMTDLDIIERLYKVTEVGTIIMKTKQDPRYKQQWVWGVWNRKDVARILCAIYPLLGVRRGEAVARAAEGLARRPKATGPKPYRPCGTRAAASRHRFHGEKPCESCLAAEREYRNYRNNLKREDRNG